MHLLCTNVISQIAKTDVNTLSRLVQEIASGENVYYGRVLIPVKYFTIMLSLEGLTGKYLDKRARE